MEIAVWSLDWAEGEMEYLRQGVGEGVRLLGEERCDGGG